MTDQFAAVMRQAVQSLRGQKVVEATRLIQNALRGKLPHESATTRAEPLTTPSPPKSEGERAKLASEAKASRVADTVKTSGLRVRRPLGDALKALRKGRLNLETSSSLPRSRSFASPVIPDAANFLTRSYSCAAGARDYKLYVPSSAKERQNGLVVMLHGCKQDPDDFAAGTDMNAVAETHGLLVAYPAQNASANSASCWNWFNPGDQARDRGEPSIIAGITRELVKEFGVDRRRVFIAGLSAGGAMAAVMGEAYPDLFAAIAVHSGIACGSANDVISAFSAMRGETIAAARREIGPQRSGFRVRTIIFQGSADRTVSPSNAERIIADAAGRFPSAKMNRAEGSRNGRQFIKIYALDEHDIPAVECWLVEGAGHAWSGGQPEGSFTDSQGPDASREMVRFFLADAKP